MAPIVHGLEAQYSDRMNFVYLDIDDPANDDFKKTLGYLAQPHIFLLDPQGNILDKWVGNAGETRYKEAIEKALQ